MQLLGKDRFTKIFDSIQVTFENLRKISNYLRSVWSYYFLQTLQHFEWSLMNSARGNRENLRENHSEQQTKTWYCNHQHLFRKRNCPAANAWCDKCKRHFAFICRIALCIWWTKFSKPNLTFVSHLLEGLLVSIHLEQKRLPLSNRSIRPKLLFQAQDTRPGADFVHRHMSTSIYDYEIYVHHKVSNRTGNLLSRRFS